MFQSSKIVKDLIWHAQDGKFDGKMHHPSDSPSWKVIDHRWPDFAAKPRNLRLAISADGINPHSSLSCGYSCWPVVMITYNLPSWLCMKIKFMMLSLLISGLQQLGNDIDIYLAPLIENLKTLWEIGVEAYDAYQIKMHEIIIGTLLNIGLNLKTWEIPEGYCSNFRNLVSTKDLKLYGLKSHDYHTLMQQLLPVALRSLLPKHKVVDVSTLDKLQNELVVTLCLLEKYFPSSFFDIMIHLMVHLVREVRLCGPVYFRWMYPFERFMKVLKGYVRNHNHPEGCIVECYIVEEAIEFCTEYLSNVDAIGVPSITNVDHKVGAPIPGGHITEVDSNLLLQAHHYVLENTTIIQPYIEEHMKWLKLNNPRQSKRQKWLQEENMRTFTHWLPKKLEVAIADKEPISETLRWIAHGPTHYVSKYHGYVINGCHYNTKDHDEVRVTQNSGVSIVATTMQISSAKDKNPVLGELCFYGIITKIWDLNYTMFRIPVFKCNWVDKKSGIKVDEFGLTLVDFTKMVHKSDPFIFASQAKQVFYDSDDFMDNSIERHPLITTLLEVESFDTMDDSDVICIRENCEGLWIDNKSSMDNRKSMIIRNRNRGIKLVIKYNADGIYVRESFVHLTSYLGVLARTMVPIRYNTWRDVPKQLKDKLWDSIEIAFTLDKKSRRNCMLTLGKCFRSFKNTLTVKHILPFKDEPEFLKKPPAEYHVIDDEDWNIFVKNRLSEKFQEYREVQKQRKEKHIYNHHLSRKGYAGLEEEMMIEVGSTESIDKSLLWKRAMQKKKKNGSYDDVVIPVVEKIDELMKESQESGISYSGSNDILSQVLAKGKHYTPGQYFNSMSEHVVRDILKATQERQAKFEADVLAKLSQIGVATPQSDVSSSNMKSKLLLLPEVVEKPIHKVEEETLPMKIEPHMKVRKFELAIGTRENTVAGGTIVMDCLMLNEGKAQGVEVPNDVFGESFKTFLMKEDMDMIISLKEVSANCVIYYIWHLQKKLSDARLTEQFVFINPALVSKAGMGKTTKENKSRLIANHLMHAKRVDYIFIPYNPNFHWVLVALDMRTMTAYYLDPMQKALRIHPPEKQRPSKREPTWVKVVMPSFQSSRSCRSHFDDSHMFSSHDN
ncbi:hypothetical protein AAG906_028394 [Vitis piasezkii]